MYKRSFICQITNKIFDSKLVFNETKFRLADVYDHSYFLESLLVEYGETVNSSSSLFRSDICIDYSNNQCENNSRTYSLYLLVEQSGKKAFLTILSF